MSSDTKLCMNLSKGGGAEQAATVLHEEGRPGGCQWAGPAHIQAAAVKDGVLAVGLPTSVQLLALQQAGAWQLQPTAELELEEQVSAVALSEAAGLQVSTRLPHVASKQQMPWPCVQSLHAWVADGSS